MCEHVELFLGQSMLAQNVCKAGQHETSEICQLIIIGIRKVIRITDVKGYASVIYVGVLLFVEFVGGIGDRGVNDRVPL